MLQRTSVEIQPTTLTIRVGLLGGIESYRALQYELDRRGDPDVSAAEIDAWLRMIWIPAVVVELDGQRVQLDTVNTTASFVGAPEEVFLAQPLVIAVHVPIPVDGKRHELRIRNSYSLFHTEHQLEVQTGPGVDAKPSANAGSESVVSFRTDPGLAPGPTTLVSSSTITASDDRPWLSSIWIWLVIAGPMITVSLWLYVARRRDQAVRPVAVRQSQATRKKPVAVRTIDAPDE